MNVFACEWIANGWMIALRERGGLNEMCIKQSATDSAAYAGALTSTLRLWSATPHLSSIMLSRDDYSLLSEFAPEVKKLTSPSLGQLEHPPDEVGRSSMTLEGTPWLIPGWIFALRSHGGYHIAHVTANADDAEDYTVSLLTGIKALADREDTAAIYLSENDYSVAAANLSKAE